MDYPWAEIVGCFAFADVLTLVPTTHIVPPLMQFVTSAQLKQALVIREKIEQLEKELTLILDGGEIPVPFVRAPKQRRKMSASARRKIAAAQTARWARVKGIKATNGDKPVKVKRRKMSPAARAKIAAVAKARWAKAKAAGKSRL